VGSEKRALIYHFVLATVLSKGAVKAQGRPSLGFLTEDLAMRTILAIVSTLLAANAACADKLVLVAGGGSGTSGVPATEAQLIQPFGIDFDQSGNYYLVELKGERVLKVDSRGVLTVVGGTGKKGNDGDGGPATQATFNGMHSLAIARDGSVYLADTWNNRVRKLDPKTGVVYAFAGSGNKGYAGDGGAALKADFGGIYCVALDPAQAHLYLADLDNRRIRAVDLKSGIVRLVAGNGTKGVPADGADAKTEPLVDPRAVAVDRQGHVYILERSGHALRVVDRSGKIRTVAGTGQKGNSGDGGDARQATLNGPKHLCIDQADNVIIADTANHVIRKYSPASGRIERLAGTGKKGASGSGGEPLSVSFNEPHGIFVDPAGTLYIVDSANHRVFRWEK
jgi:DNA-binding beta-propeller fold protein YncE